MGGTYWRVGCCVKRWVAPLGGWWAISLVWRDWTRVTGDGWKSLFWGGASQGIGQFVTIFNDGPIAY
jgi:hypothetical protein